MSETRIDGIKERLAKAEYLHDCGYGFLVSSPQEHEEAPEEVAGLVIRFEHEDLGDTAQAATAEFLLHAKRDMEWLVAERERLLAWVNARVKADLNGAAGVPTTRKLPLLTPAEQAAATAWWLRSMSPVVTPSLFTEQEKVIAAGVELLRPEENPRAEFFPFTPGGGAYEPDEP
jgi:hypothetical protein